VSTKTALNGPILHKGTLKRIEIAFPGKAFNPQDALALSLDSQDQAGKNGLIVPDNGACTTLALSIALFGSR
jgi:hypothetical protein